jgi:hypothetical protein
MMREAWDKLKKEGEPIHGGIERGVREQLLEQTRIADERLQSIN